jgi:hypothetical protein
MKGHKSHPLRLDDINSAEFKEDIYLSILVESSAEIGAFGLDLIFPTKNLRFVGLEKDRTYSQF